MTQGTHTMSPKGKVLCGRRTCVRNTGKELDSQEARIILLCSQYRRGRNRRRAAGAMAPEIYSSVFPMEENMARHESRERENVA